MRCDVVSEVYFFLNSYYLFWVWLKRFENVGIVYEDMSGEIFIVIKRSVRIYGEIVYYVFDVIGWEVFIDYFRFVVF